MQNEEEEGEKEIEGKCYEIGYSKNFSVIIYKVIADNE
jgi:hypothetical protein